MYTQDKNKAMCHMYVIVLTVIFIINIVSHFCLSYKSIEYKRNLAEKENEYRELDNDNIEHQKELEKEMKKILAGTHDILLANIVMCLVSAICFFPDLVKKTIEEFANWEQEYYYSRKILEISRVFGVILIIWNCKSIIDSAIQYAEMAEHIEGVFGVMFRILEDNMREVGIRSQ